MLSPSRLLKIIGSLHWPKFGPVALAMALCLGGLGWQTAALPQPAADAINAGQTSIAATSLNHDFNQTIAIIRQQEDSETSAGVTTPDDPAIESDIDQIDLTIGAHDYIAARRQLTQLQSLVKQWSAEVAAATAAGSPNASASQPAGLQVPIILYHYPPADLESQLQYLISHHYTDIDFDQLTAALTNGAALPPKPVILTFDDGFENQTQAVALLEKYRLKATFFIIDGGPGSNWCIGAGRKNLSCGQSYLTWDQVRQIDHNPLFTIGSHTINHLSLPLYPANIQSQEIIGGKQELEQELGHAVKYFAYPDGTYNAATLALVKQAGFAAAVSTLPGTIQTPADLYTLHRIRTAIGLP